MDCPGRLRHAPTQVPDCGPRASLVCQRRVVAAAVALWLSSMIASVALGESRLAERPRPPSIQPGASEGHRSATQDGAAELLQPTGPAHLIAKALFFIYQRGLSPSKGQKCPMSPPCSEY